MITVSEGLILRKIAYKDSLCIVSIFTLEKGLEAFVAYPSNSKKAKIKPAYLSPLNFIEFSSSEKPLRALQVISEIKMKLIYKTLQEHPLKNLIAQFILEILQKSIREHEGNPELYEFLFKTFYGLDEALEPNPSFNLHFLLDLSAYLGFCPEPGRNISPGIFDLKEGVFVTCEPLHNSFLNLELSQALNHLLQCRADGKKYGGNLSERRQLMEALISFFRLHLPAFGEVKSLSVLKEIFS